MRLSRALLRRVEVLEASAEAQAPGEFGRLPLKIALWGQFAAYLVEWLTPSETAEWSALLASVGSGEKTREEMHDQVTRIFAKVEARRATAAGDDFVPTFFRELERAQLGQGA